MTDQDKNSEKITISDPDTSDSGTTDATLSDATESIDEVASLNARLAEMTAHWQRERADFINYKRRVEEEKKDIRKYAIFDFALDLLKVMDYFESSISFAENLPEQARNVIIGVEYTIQEMSSVLSTHGISPIAVKVGDLFDSSLMEATDCVEKEDAEPGTVLSIRRKGWKFHDRILRAAAVVVSTAPTENVQENCPS